MKHRLWLYRLYLNFVVCVQDEADEPDPGARGGSQGGGGRKGRGNGGGRKGGGYVISLLCNAYAN